MSDSKKEDKMKELSLKKAKAVQAELAGSEEGAVTIEYVIIVIVVIGIGGALLAFQTEIKNAVTKVQDSLANLVTNMTNNLG
jgi:Flp pilus assembly pilin Flp